MTKLLIDTNIVIDLLAKREHYQEAAELFSLADKGLVQLVVSSLTIANTHYIISKLKSQKEAKNILAKFNVLVDILNLDQKVIALALSSTIIDDFEDGLQYYTAIENQIDIIITRNKKDFKKAKLPILTAKEYLSKTI
ncbi:MAG: PIN domain-containing protein [Chitinophagales bacterium]|nr:PIN domain-containing protein [Chitinophagales bacterium]